MWSDVFTEYVSVFDSFRNDPLQRKAAPYELLNTENLLNLTVNPVLNTHTHTQ